MKYKYSIEIETSEDLTVNEVCAMIDDGMESLSNIKYRITSVADFTDHDAKEEKK